MAYCATCKKSLFRSEAEANTRLEEIRENPETVRIPVRVYFEPVCGWWHMTSWRHNFGDPDLEVLLNPPVVRQRKAAPRNGEVTVSYRPVIPLEQVHPAALAVALQLAGGDESRLVAQSHITVMVVNNPATIRAPAPGGSSEPGDPSGE